MEKKNGLKEKIVLVVGSGFMLLGLFVVFSVFLGDVNTTAAPAQQAPAVQRSASDLGVVFLSYIAEFAVVFVICAIMAAGGYSTRLRFAGMRQYTPHGEYVGYSQISFPETTFTPAPANGADWFGRIVIMVVVMYLVVKLPIYLMFGVDTARLFPWLYSLIWY